RDVLPEPLSGLNALALNLRWAWHESTRSLLAGIDPRLWQQVHGDPARLLGSLSPARLAELAADEDFVHRTSTLAADLAHYLPDDRWYQQEQRRREREGHAALPRAIAYFSAEFGLTGALDRKSTRLNSSHVSISYAVYCSPKT